LDASTTTRSRYWQPALLGGAVGGVLSALPFIGAFNVCCCLWVVTGGVVAAYLLQQNQQTPITAADGAIVGIFAGLIGAAINSLISLPISMVMGPVVQGFFERLSTMSNLPPEARDALENMANRRADMGPFGLVLAFFLGLCFNLFAGAIFSTLGGLLGSAIFAKKVPPAPPASI
jgi:hypothetical protein